MLPAPAAYALPTAARETIMQEEIGCLALTIYFEARGETLAGKLAVAHVVLNRMQDSRFPQNICAVVRQGGEEILHRCQLSWYCDGLSDRPRDAASWRESLQIAWGAYAGRLADPTDGALWFHATHAWPSWRDAARGNRIGRHIFYARLPGATAVASR